MSSDINRINFNHLSRYSTDVLEDTLRNLKIVKNNKSVLKKLKDNGESVLKKIELLEGEISFRNEVSGLNNLFDGLKIDDDASTKNKHVQYVLSKEVLNDGSDKFKTNSTRLEASSRKLTNEKSKVQMLQMEKSLNLQADRFKKLKFVEE